MSTKQVRPSSSIPCSPATLGGVEPGTVATLTVRRYLGTKPFRRSLHLAHGLAAVREALHRDGMPDHG